MKCTFSTNIEQMENSINYAAIMNGRGQDAVKLVTASKTIATADIQVNIDNESQKDGITPSAAPELIEVCHDVCYLNFQGFMCIPPAGQDPSGYFLLLKLIATDHDQSIVSMGMKTEFAQAIVHGVTHVLIGGAIFGARAPVAL